MDRASKSRGILLKAVGDIKKLDSFMEDVWISYCHVWDTENVVANRSVSLDPARYDDSFLIDFLRHVSVVVQTDEARRMFTQRIPRTCRPPPQQ